MLGELFFGFVHAFRHRTAGNDNDPASGQAIRAARLHLLSLSKSKEPEIDIEDLPPHFPMGTPIDFSVKRVQKQLVTDIWTPRGGLCLALEGTRGSHQRDAGGARSPETVSRPC